MKFFVFLCPGTVTWLCDRLWLMHLSNKLDMNKNHHFSEASWFLKTTLWAVNETFESLQINVDWTSSTISAPNWYLKSYQIDKIPIIMMYTKHNSLIQIFSYHYTSFLNCTSVMHYMFIQFQSTGLVQVINCVMNVIIKRILWSSIKKIYIDTIQAKPYVGLILKKKWRTYKTVQ